ncbi:MAG: carbohydrate ABC transporter permease, partial [Pseudomonadota bacterium]
MADIAQNPPAAPTFPLWRRRIWFHAGTALLFLGGWIMVFPFVWMLSSSLKPTDEVFDSDFTLWPRTFAGFENYTKVLFEQPYLTFLMNSFIVCAGILVVQLLTAVPAAYALAKLKFRGSTILFGA